MSVSNKVNDKIVLESAQRFLNELRDYDHSKARDFTMQKHIRDLVSVLQRRAREDKARESHDDE